MTVRGAPPRSRLADGIRDSLPLGLALIPVAMAFGYLAHSVGLSWWLAGLMSAIVYAGPAQFIAAAMIGIGAGTVTIAATTFVTNLRYSLFAASLAPFMSDAPPRRLLFLGQAVADGSYALALHRARTNPDASRLDEYLLGSFIVSFGVWVPATVAGALLGDVVPNAIAAGLGFATPAIFIAFLIPYVRDAPAALVMLVAGIGTVLGNEHLASGAGALAAIVAAVIIGGALRSRRTTH
jgi:4-azaleucine resistance transporter AzlC